MRLRIQQITGHSGGDSPPGLPAARRRFLGRLIAAATGGALLGRVGKVEAATQAYEPFLGEIMLFAGNSPPAGWALCNGQILPISQHSDLFTLIGTTYGGDGRSTFGLPDLRGRAPVHAGGSAGPGLTERTLGEYAGEEAHTLGVDGLPAHSHLAMADGSNGSSDSPTGKLPARNAGGVPQYGANATQALAPGAIAVTGGSQPHNNMPPYLAINFCIALEGVWPST